MLKMLVRDADVGTIKLIVVPAIRCPMKRQLSALARNPPFRSFRTTVDGEQKSQC